jgi:hypothetical protein
MLSTIFSVENAKRGSNEGKLMAQRASEASVSADVPSVSSVSDIVVGREPITQEFANEGASAPVWQQAHERLALFAKRRSGFEWEEGRLLRAAFVARSHVRLGFGSFDEYVERLFGYSPRQTREKLRVAEALDQLPKVSVALQGGELTWSAVRELTRVATSATESEWLEAARDCTARDVEELVAGHRVGDRPCDLPDPDVRRYRVGFEVSGETRALIADAIAKLRRDTGGHVDDDAALLLMARSVLGGPNDEGRASYQVAVTICERRRRGEQLGNGTRNDVRPEVVEMCECDAQHVGQCDSGDQGADGARGAKRATQTIPKALRRRVWRRDSGRCVVVGCRNSTFVDVHHLVSRAAGGAAQARKLGLLVWRPPSRRSRTHSRHPGTAGNWAHLSACRR